MATTEDILHIYNDGSILKRSTAKQLIAIPIWKGQRIMSAEHKEAIKSELINYTYLDSGYVVIVYREIDVDGHAVISKYIADGQHRCSILREYFAENLCVPDFAVTYTQKEVGSETEAIAYFNKINNCKPIVFEEEPAIVVGRIIAALEGKFNTDKKNPMIRVAKTRRPFIYNEELRAALIAVADRLKKVKIEKFIAAVIAWNIASLRDFDIELAAGSVKKSEVNIVEKASDLKFALGRYATFPWIDYALHRP